MSYRMAQVNELIRGEISPIIANIKDKYLGLVTLVSVETAPDLSNATLWVSVMNKDVLEDKEIIKTLKKYAREMNNHMHKRLNLKKLPKLQFKVDRSNEAVNRVNDIFDVIDKGGNIPL